MPRIEDKNKDIRTRILEAAARYANRRENKNMFGVMYDAKLFLKRCDFADWITGDQSTDYGDYECDYFGVGDTYDETIVFEDNNEAGCYTATVTTIPDWKEAIKKKKLEKEDETPCVNCDEFSSSKHVECPECEHYKDRDEKVPEIGSQFDSHFEELCNIDSEIVWVHDELQPTHQTKSRYTSIVVRLQYTDYYNHEWANEHGSYHVEVLAANPGIQTKKKIADIDAQFDGAIAWETMSRNERVYELVSLGNSATLWQQTGWDSDELLKLAIKQVAELQITIGFRLDGPQNAVGSTGWDFMRGDITAGIRRYAEQRKAKKEKPSE